MFKSICGKSFEELEVESEREPAVHIAIALLNSKPETKENILQAANIRGGYIFDGYATDVLPLVKVGDRVYELGALGGVTGEKGKVLAADTTRAVVKWDDDGSELLRQRYLQKIAEA
jgi:hypothetical protein